jgi:hypothetical protein
MGNPKGRNVFDGYGYRMVLPDGYVPVAIPTQDIQCNHHQSTLQSLVSYSFELIHCHIPQDYVYGIP